MIGEAIIVGMHIVGGSGPKSIHTISGEALESAIIEFHSHGIESGTVAVQVRFNGRRFENVDPTIYMDVVAGVDHEFSVLNVPKAVCKTVGPIRVDVKTGAVIDDMFYMRNSWSGMIYVTDPPAK